MSILFNANCNPSQSVHCEVKIKILKEYPFGHGEQNDLPARHPSLGKGGRGPSVRNYSSVQFKQIVRKFF